MRYLCFFFIAVLMSVGGCGNVRFAPGEKQKQNAWLHNRTAFYAAQRARQEESSETLRGLTNLCELQSQAFTTYYGLPQEYPAAATIEDMLGAGSTELARQATLESGERLGPFDLADSAIEIGIGISALFGGAYGVRALGFLKEAKAKTQALREIIYGNEALKKTDVSVAAAFKEAQKNQSAETRKIVTEVKNS